MLPSGRDWHQLTRSKPSNSDGQGGAVAGTGDAHGRNAGQRPGIAHRHDWHRAKCGTGSQHSGSGAQIIAPGAAGHMLTITAMLPSGKDWNQFTSSRPNGSGGRGGALACTGDTHGRNAGQRPGIARSHGPPVEVSTITGDALHAVHPVTLEMRTPGSAGVCMDSGYFYTLRRTAGVSECVPGGSPQALNSGRVRCLPMRCKLERFGEVMGMINRRMKRISFHLIEVSSLCLQFVLTLSSVPYRLETRMVAGFRCFVLSDAVFSGFSSRGKSETIKNDVKKPPVSASGRLVGVGLRGQAARWGI